MKQLLFFVLLAFLILPVLEQRKLSEVDLRVNGIGSGTAYFTVINKLGKPLQSKKRKVAADHACSHSAETYLTLFYPGLEIVLLGDGRGRDLFVYSIVVTSPKWSASGVRIGARVRDVQTKFGEPNSKAKESGETVWCFVTKDNLGRVNCYFRNDKLVRVEMMETLC